MRIIRLKFIIIAIFVFLCPFLISAYKGHQVSVTIPLYNAQSKRELPSAEIRLYNMADTSFIGNASYTVLHGGYFIITLPAGILYNIQIVPKIRVVTDNNTTVYTEDNLLEHKEIELDLRDYEGTRMELEPIYFGKRISKELNEVTVTPSRIMFYHKGDTLVYNANAFVLAEGSMLDALIKQLPGVNIDKNGVITCNGRKVENLLLNGKDFFNGKRELMLENISAYTVKDIAVYEKAGMISEMLNQKVQGDMTYVMDVRLKKEYMTGLMGNTDVGNGTKDRYLARLFGMWYSSSASVTVFGAANNLSSMANPGAQDGAWSAADISDGLKTNKSGGMTYTWTGPHNKLSFQGSADVKHVKTTVDQSRSTVNFLPDGDVYRLSNSRNISRNLTVATDHWLTYRLNSGVMIQAFPNFTYSDIRTAGDIIDVASSEETANLNAGFGDFIYNTGGELTGNEISRYLSRSASKGKTFDGKLLARTVLAVGPRTGQRGALYVSAVGSLKTHEDYMHNDYLFTTRENGFTPEATRRYDACIPTGCGLWVADFPTIILQCFPAN